jgi:hypothetical protein
MDATQERLFKLEVRLAATEYLVANVYAVAIAQMPDAVHKVKTANDTLRTMLRNQTVPGVEAVWSDHVMAEMQDAMERVLGIMEDMVANLAKAHGQGQVRPASPMPAAARGSAMSAVRTAWSRLSS